MDAQARLDRRAGEVAAIIYNVNRDPKKTKAVAWDDFFPRPGTKKESGEMSDDQRYQLFRAWVHVHNERIVRQQPN